MNCDMVVYESRESRLRSTDDTERFDRSRAVLEAAGIRIGMVMCSGIEDIDPDGEAFSIVSENGMDSLPMAEYQGVVIAMGQYPSDQDLADFLDVPDGVLGVNRTRPPAMANDIQPSCGCGQRR